MHKNLRDMLAGHYWLPVIVTRYFQHLRRNISKQHLELIRGHLVTGQLLVHSWMFQFE